MRKTYVVFLLLALLILALAGLSVPRVLSRQTLSVQELDTVPDLYAAYQQAAGETPGLIPGAELEILELVSIWGSCEYYILPCYRAEMTTVPQNGEASWSTALYTVTACSGEHTLTAKLCRLEVRNLCVEVETGAETFLSSKVSISPGGMGYDMWEGSRVEPDAVFDCGDGPTVGIHLLAATAMQAQAEDQITTGAYVWSFDLYCCSKRIQEYRKITLTQDYVVNAV